MHPRTCEQCRRTIEGSHLTTVILRRTGGNITASAVHYHDHCLRTMPARTQPADDDRPDTEHTR